MLILFIGRLKFNAFMFSIPILQGHFFPPFKIYQSYVNFKLMLPNYQILGLVCKIKRGHSNRLVSSPTWKKERKTRHFYYIIRNKIITHREGKCTKYLKGFFVH